MFALCRFVSFHVVAVRFGPCRFVFRRYDCFRFIPFHAVSFRFVFLPFRVHLQEYEKLKADARAQGSGQREEAAALERKLASARSQLDQLGSNKVRGVLAVRDAAPCPPRTRRGARFNGGGGGVREKAGNCIWRSLAWRSKRLQRKPPAKRLQEQIWNETPPAD